MSLRVKLAVLAIGLAIAPLSLVAWLLVDVNADTVETASRELQIAVLEDLARTIDDELDRSATGLDEIARVLADDQLDPDATLALVKATLESREQLDHAAIYAADGALIDVVRQGERSAGAAAEQLDEGLAKQAREDKLATGEVVEVAGYPRVPMVLAIRAGDQITGYVVGLVPLSGVQARVEHLSLAHFGGRPEALFLVDRSLRIIAHVDERRILDSAAGEGALVGIDPGALSPMIARAGEFERGDREMVGTVVGLPYRPWAAVAQVPRDKAYASLERMKKIVLGTVAATMFLALLIGLLGARLMTAPLKRLVAFANDLAKRRFDRRVEVRARDEFGVLAQAMSAAAAELELSEERAFRDLEIRADLSRYLPPEIVERISRREQDMGLGGQQCEITVMFVDVVGFTPMTERLPAEQVVEILNHLFTIATEIVFHHGGTVDKFIGDAMMAFWGAPTPSDDHAAAALRTIDELLMTLYYANTDFEERFGVSLRLSVGINSGVCVVGNIGSESRMEYTAIGDVVNVAARLQGIARASEVLISRETRAHAGDEGSFRYIPRGPTKVTGRESPVEVFQVSFATDEEHPYESS